MFDLMPNLAYLIPLLPLTSFIIIIFTGYILKEKSAYVAIFIMGGCLLLSFFTFLQVYSGGSVEVEYLWIQLGSIKFNMGYILDSLSSMMLLVVSLVSFLIHIYSVGYMHGDLRYPRFFAYLSLFTASMLGLVLANNLLLTYISWELVGLCSYLLIGFWFEKISAAKAAKKAFLVTRTGDAGMLLGIILLFAVGGTLNFTDLFHKVEDGKLSSLILTISTLLIFCGAIGKSAQFPLHVWLPDAMEGPTPVSALIHAATMVAAGVYLVARTFLLFVEAASTLIIVAYIGAITAFMAATIALVTNDIKRILAYSTISQLGYMMFGLGVGGYTAGTFHLMTHAFFKALLFLCAGSVIHAVHTQDIWEMGGLAKKMKITVFTFIIGSLSLSGIPPLAGFWSKDEILFSAYKFGQMSGHWLIYVVGVLSAFLTSFYMFRLIFVAFYGSPRKEVSFHESPKVMTIPLIILAVFAIIAGFPGSPFMHHKYQSFIYFKDPHHPELSLIFASFSVLIAVLGILSSALIYHYKIVSTSRLINLLPPLTPFIYKMLKNKYWMDEILYFIFVRTMFAFSFTFTAFDKYVVDGIVNLLGWITTQLSILHNLFDTYIVDGIVNLIGETTKIAGGILRYVQSGLVQNYMFFAVVGIVLFIVFRFYLF